MNFRRVAVVMAGGSGERFWPLSTPEKPKQLLHLSRPDQTLLHESIERIAPVCDEAVRVATSASLQSAVREAAYVPDEFVYGEPLRRNTLGGLVWAAANLIAEHDDWENITMAAVTADHLIGEPEVFRIAVKTALNLAEQTQGLVTLGVKPTRAETGYGYIQRSHEGTKALAFKEKPSKETAEEYVAQGDYYWNSGMFFWTLGAFAQELAAAQPEVNLCGIANAIKSGDVEGATELFAQLPNLSIDFALLEKSDKVHVVPAEFPWDDIGSWDSIERSFDQNEHGNTVIGDAILHDVTDSIVYNHAPEVTVGVLGLTGIVVVVTDGAVLVTNKDSAQKVKEISVKANEIRHSKSNKSVP